MITDAIHTDGQGQYLKRDPRSRLPVNFDWSAWLLKEGTTISASSMLIDAPAVIDTPGFTSTVAGVFVSGGVAGSSYVLRNTITCANGLIDSRSMRIVCENR